MSERIQRIWSTEILDSRGYPTIRTHVELNNGCTASASVPSGASTGEGEAVELRDGDLARYDGKGVLRAIRNVSEEIAPHLIGMDPCSQAEIDRTMIDLDGTVDKGRLGANAILSVSMAVARVAARAKEMPLYRYLGGPEARRIPVPMMNVINGGKHADNSIDFQEFMIVPHGESSFSEALQHASEIFFALKGILHRRGDATSVGDEGGFAPNLDRNEQACEVILEAIRQRKLAPRDMVGIALDPAASSFAKNGQYELRGKTGGIRSSDEMISLYSRWINDYPILSIEDGLSENDWTGFRILTEKIGDRVQIVGDDIYVTNAKFIKMGIEDQSTNAVLIKLNQIGTVTETIAAVELCREAGWNFIVSHRSGETEDTFIADFAVAMGGGQIKTGSLCRSERVAKYNRLLEIEQELGRSAIFRSPFLQ